MSSPSTAPRFFLALIILTAVLLALVLRPVASELFLAIVLTGVLWPVQRWLTRRLRRRGAAAGVLCLLVVVLVIGPLTALAAFIVRDGSDGVRFVVKALRSEEVTRLTRHLPSPIRKEVRAAIQRLPRDLDEAVAQAEPDAQRAAAEVVGNALAATGSFLVSATFMMIALFFLLVHGDELVHWLDTVSPLRRGQTHELLINFKQVSYAVIVSTVITGAVQAVAALIGYLIAGVPNPVFFAVVTFFVGFIPALGAASVCLIAAALLVVTGHPYMAIFLAAWGLVVVGLVDNVVKPLLIRGGMETHGAIVFFALIGGLAAFGPIGLLIGPLVVSLFLALLRMYHRDFGNGEVRSPSVPGFPAMRQAPPSD